MSLEAELLAPLPQPVPVPQPVVELARGGDVDAPPGIDAPPGMGRNLAALFSGQVVTWTMTLIWTVIVPRVLGPDGFGVVTAALSAGGVFAIVLGLGTRNYLVRAIVMRREDAPTLVGTAISLRLVLSPLVLVAAFVFARLAHYGHEQTTALYLATAMNILLLLNEPLLAMFQAIERMKYLAFSDMINKTVQSLGGIAVVLVGLGAIGLTANMAVVAAVVIALNVIWLRPYLRVDLRTTARAMVQMTRESLTYWATTIFFTIYLWVDTIMLSTMTPSRVVGWYGAATTLFQTLMFLPNLLATTWLPRLVESFRGGQPELARTARKPLEFVLVISAPMAAGTVMASHVIVHVLYGSAYAHAVPTLTILGLCLAPTYLNIMMSQVLIAEGRQVVFKWLMLAATIVNPLINLGLIKLTEHRFHNGSIGAALALLLTELLVAAGALLVVRRMFTRDGLRRWGLAVVASAAMWGVAEVARPLGEPIALLAGVVTLVALALILRIPTEDERSIVIGALKRMQSSLVRSR
jgi:O-antigen/teichoic acid export membrane protein